MTSNTTARLVLATAILVAVASLLSIALNDPGIRLPGRWADVMRALTLALAAYTVALMVLMSRRAARIKLDPGDRITRPLAAWGLSYLMLLVFAVLSLVNQWRTDRLTWRTPLLAAAVVVANSAMGRLDRRFNAMMNRAHGGVVKLTVVDTAALPGTRSVDLSSGGTVITPPPESKPDVS